VTERGLVRLSMRKGIHNPRILVVDDNRDIHSDFHKILYTRVTDSSLADAETALFGTSRVQNAAPIFKIESAYQGEEALERVSAALRVGRPYAVAFLDMRMPPGWDGVETAAQLWTQDPDLQIVLCTAFSDHSWDEIRERLGHSDRLLILKKPFDPIEVLQLAQTLSEKWRLMQQTRAHLADLKLSVVAQTQELTALNAELSATNERYRQLLENTSALAWEIDPSTWRTQYLAPQCNTSFGTCGEDPSALIELLHPEDRDAFKVFVKDAAHGLLKVDHIDSRLTTPLEGPRYIRSLVSLRDPLPVRPTVFGISLDITQQKRLEMQLAQAHKLESIGQLAAGIAHEINTPTQFIGDNVRFLQESVGEVLEVLNRLLAVSSRQDTRPLSPGEIQALLEDVDVAFLVEQLPKAIAQSLEGVGRIAKIVGAMKDFSHPAVDRTLYDLNRAIESTVAVATNEWKYVAEVQTHLDATLRPIAVMPGAFNQVILNLLVNAAHAVGERASVNPEAKGLITISTRQCAPWVEIRIQDTGCGIAEANRSRIFDPFFTTKPVGKGTGQGLAIAYDVIVTKHQGEIEVESTLGVGTTFIVRLPLSTEVSDASAAA
jgi:two-component system NtrC family sensor kinase